MTPFEAMALGLLIMINSEVTTQKRPPLPHIAWFCGAVLLVLGGIGYLIVWLEGSPQ